MVSLDGRLAGAIAPELLATVAEVGGVVDADEAGCDGGSSSYTL